MKTKKLTKPKLKSFSTGLESKASKTIKGANNMGISNPVLFCTHTINTAYTNVLQAKKNKPCNLPYNRHHENLVLY